MIFRNAARQYRFGNASLWMSFLGIVYLTTLFAGAPILGTLLESTGLPGDTELTRYFGVLLYAAPLMLVLQILAVVLGTIALLRNHPQRLFAILGVVSGLLAAFFLVSGALFYFYAPLNDPKADPYGPVEVIHPPKRNQPPPKSTLSFGGQTVSAEPTFWCKYVQSTMFCKGHEVLPLPPEDETLEVTVGGTMMFAYGGEEDLRRRPNGMAPSHAPLYVGGVWLGGGWEARDGPNGLRVLENPRGSGRSFENFDVKRLGKHADNRFSIDRDLPAGGYVIHFLTRMPRGEANYYFRVQIVAEGGWSRNVPAGSRGKEV